MKKTILLILTLLGFTLANTGMLTPKEIIDQSIKILDEKIMMFGDKIKELKTHVKQPSVK